MQNQNQRILISCLVILLITCLCLSALSIVGATFFIISGQEVSQLLPSAAEEEANTRPSEVQAQMDLIEQQVSDIRGLQPNSTIQRALMSPEELRQRVIDDFLKDYDEEEARNDGRVLWVLGLLEADFDLRSLYIDLYSEQIAGFYDPETKEMYVVQKDGFFGPERITYAHEYVHALQDQNYDLENGLNLNDESCEADSERCAAASALVEGDASKLEMEWFLSKGTNEDRSEVSDFYSSFSSPIFDSAPEFIRQDLLFSYSQGADFVQSLLDDGGWPAVDAAYKNLPVSTEQILHPERYPDDQPQVVNLPDLGSALGADWAEIDQGVIGEWYTYQILAYGRDADFRLGDSQASKAAEGWGGDRYIVFHNQQSDELVLVIQTVWDSSRDASEFSKAFEKYGDQRFGKGQSQSQGRIWEQTGVYSEIVLADEQTTWLLAPNAETAQKLRLALQIP